MRFNVPADPSFERIQAQTDIDRQVRLARMLFVTVIPGQDAVYALKVNEALSIVADPQLGAGVPDSATPHLTDEAAEDGVSRFEKAAEILTRDQHWKAGSQMIEALRRSANAALAAAKTAPEIRAAADIDWLAVRAFAQT